MAASLTHFEMEMLLRAASMRWDADDRRYIAKLLPALYAKYTGTSVALSACGDSVELSIAPAAPAPKTPMFNANKGAPWE